MRKAQPRSSQRLSFTRPRSRAFSLLGTNIDQTTHPAANATKA